MQSRLEPREPHSWDLECTLHSMYIPNRTDFSWIKGVYHIHYSTGDPTLKLDYLDRLFIFITIGGNPMDLSVPNSTNT